MKAYKLFRVLKDGSISPLFINKRLRIKIGEWMLAECHPTPAYAIRRGWHCTGEPKAAHLSEKKRAWFEVEMDDFEILNKSKKYGGPWYIAQRIKVLREVL